MWKARTAHVTSFKYWGTLSANHLWISCQPFPKVTKYALVNIYDSGSVLFGKTTCSMVNESILTLSQWVQAAVYRIILCNFVPVSNFDLVYDLYSHIMSSLSLRSTHLIRQISNTYLSLFISRSARLSTLFVSCLSEQLSSLFYGPDASLAMWDYWLVWLTFRPGSRLAWVLHSGFCDCSLYSRRLSPSFC